MSIYRLLRLTSIGKNGWSTDEKENGIYGDTDFDSEICYNGAIYDESTGIYYLSARYYDPEDGRFLTRDSYRGNTANPMTWHLYAYCANNPVNYENPSGHVLANVIGGAFGAGIVQGASQADISLGFHYSSQSWGGLPSAQSSRRCRGYWSKASTPGQKLLLKSYITR